MYSTRKILKETSDLIRHHLPLIMEKRYDIQWKPDGSPVTAADTFLENEISAFLKQRIDGLCFIGEESYQGQNTAQQGWVAILDPIDGTENFCSGLKEWGTALSIWHNGKHAGSMLMLPELDEVMFSGAIPRVPRSRIVGYSSSFHPDIAAGLAEQAEGRITGCAVYNLFNVIRGAFSRFVNPKGAYSWDLLAGVSLAYEAGCHVKIEGRDYDGRFLEPHQRYRIDIQHRYDLHTG